MFVYFIDCFVVKAIGYSQLYVPGLLPTMLNEPVGARTQASSMQRYALSFELSLFRPVLILISLIWKSKLLTFFLLLKLNAKQFYNYRHRNGKMVSFFKVRNNSNYISHTPFSRFYLQLLSSVSLKTASAISAYYSSSLLTSA